jgi:hypothetical protein
MCMCACVCVYSFVCYGAGKSVGEASEKQTQARCFNVHAEWQNKKISLVTPGSPPSFHVLPDGRSMMKNLSFAKEPYCWRKKDLL